MLRRFLLALPLLAAGFAGSANAQCDTTFTLVNRSGETIEQFFFNHARNPNWGPDRLGNGVLPSGMQRVYRPARGGEFDFRVVWSGGASAEMRNINICRTSNIVATRRGIRAE